MRRNMVPLKKKRELWLQQENYYPKMSENWLFNG